jgi:DNA-binding MarR family transcriptional regulator
MYVNISHMETNRPAARLVAALWSTTRALKRHLSPLLRKEHGVDFKDFMLLDAVDRDGQLNPGQLCSAMGLSPSAVSRVLDDLTSRGLVVRELDPADLRHIKVKATVKGRDVLAEARETMSDLVDDWLKGLPRAQSEALLHALEGLSDHIGRRSTEVADNREFARTALKALRRRPTRTSRSSH